MQNAAQTKLKKDYNRYLAISIKNLTNKTSNSN